MISLLITIKLSNPKILAFLKLFRYEFFLMIKSRGLIDDQLPMLLIYFVRHLLFYQHFCHFTARLGWVRVFLH